MEYAELKCKTNFSFLTGASHAEEYVFQAAQLGLKAIGITDKNGVYAIPKAYNAAKNHLAVKLIVGADVTLEDHARITLLAQDRKAYGVMCRLLTALHHGKPKGEGSIKFEEFLRFAAEDAARGLIALPEAQPMVGEQVVKQTLPDYETLKQIFGDRLYVPVSRFLDGHDKARVKQAQSIAAQYALELVATNDVHFHAYSRYRLQDAFTAIKNGVALSNSGFKIFSNHERYLKSPAQMTRLFNDLPQALKNTLVISEQCTFSPAELRYRYPSEWIPAGSSAQTYLEELTWAGAQKRYRGGVPTSVEDQLKYELKLIRELEYADYFLTIFEIVDFARTKKILCQGRGSAANSAVCYVLGITAIDPVRMNLLFERFLSADRKEPPDIDVDFEHERREEVIQHIYEKYGRHRAAMISAVVTYRKKSALREACKALGIDVGTSSAKKLDLELEKMEREPKHQKTLGLIGALSDEMLDFPRHTSIHSGGFTLSADPITEIVPVEPARMQGRSIVQWDKYDLEYLKLIKVDILALGMLSALRKTLDLTKMELHEIPAEDPKTYAMIQRAETVGTFQIESRAQISMLGRLLPATFYDLVVQVAIVRPGPIVGKMVHPYLKRRRGQEPVTFYGHEKLRRILERTCGVPLFQEQIMQIAIDLGGFTAGQADQLRRVIAGWRSKGGIEEMGHRLMAGLLKSGLPQEFAERVFLQIQGFAQYGFPESHAASFALLAYASAYLKCHHPAEFMCSLVNSQPMGFYSSHTLIDEAKRNGVKVLPVHPQFSQWDCTIENERGTVRLGWRVVTGIAEKQVQHIIEERKVRPFASLHDFLDRSRIRQNVLHRLAMGNAFDCFGYDQRHSLWRLLESNLLLANADNSQLNLFSQLSSENALALMSLMSGGGPDAVLREAGSILQNDPGAAPLFKKLDDYEVVRHEYEAYRLSTTNHPMQPLRNKVKGLPRATSKDIRQEKSGTMVKTAGLILVRQRPPTAKGVTFATLEDEFGFSDLIFHKEICEQYGHIFLHHCFIKVSGILQKDTNTVSILVKRVAPLFQQAYNTKEDLVIEPHQYF